MWIDLIYPQTPLWMDGMEKDEQLCTMVIKQSAAFNFWHTFKGIQIFPADSSSSFSEWNTM